MGSRNSHYEDEDILIDEEEVNIPSPSIFQRIFTACTSDPDDDEDDDLNDVKPAPFLQLFRFASRSEIFAFVVGSLLSVIVGLCLPAQTYLWGVITTMYVNVKEPKGDLDFMHHILRLSSLYGIGFVFIFICGYIENWLYVWAGERIAQRIRSEFISSVLAQDAAFFDKTSTGELSNRLSSNIDRIKDGIGDKIGLFIRCMSTIITGATLSLILDWRIALILVWAGPTTLICATFIPMLSSKASSNVISISDEANGISEESILNVKTVQSCNGQQTMIERYGTVLRSGVSAATRVGFISGLFEATSILNYACFRCAGIWHNCNHPQDFMCLKGSIASLNGLFDAQCFLVVREQRNSVHNVVTIERASLGPHLLAVMKARSAATVIYDIIDKRPNERDESNCDPNEAEMHLTFNNVSFTFASRAQAVLRGLSFDLLPGKSLALVGKSGCGKSTTLKLITRFLNPDNGSILLDNIPLERYDLRKLRKIIGVVSQEPSLFIGSIKENICLGRIFSDEEIEEACRIAFAHDFIMHLEKGYDSHLGPSGVALSGGQKQRIAIARAIVSNPRLLLLDEATSALDTRSEKIVQEALDKASEGRTTIVIAHRLSTIKNVDHVIVMDEGQIVESGGYEELRTKEDGVFSNMIKLQEINREVEDEDNESLIDVEIEEIETTSRFDARRSVSVDQQLEDYEFATKKGGLWSILAIDKTKTLILTIGSMLRGLDMPILAVTYLFIFGSVQQEIYEDQLFWTVFLNMSNGIFCFIIIMINLPLHAWIGETVLIDLRLSCLTSLLNRPISYFDRKETSPAACSVLLSQQPPMAIAAVNDKISIIIENGFSSILILIGSFVVCWPLGFLSLLYIVLFVIAYFLIEHNSNIAYEEVVEIDKSGELAIEMFDNMATIQQLTVESYFQDRFNNIQMARRKPLGKKIIYISLIHAITESFDLLINFLSTSIGIYLVYIGMIEIKGLFASEMCISILGFTALAMSESFKDVIAASSASRLLFALIDPTTKSSHCYDNLESKGSVTSNNVSFAYPSRPNKKTLNNISFKVEAGKSLALVGPSGGGKSTTVNLLERFYEPSSGQMLLDDIPFKSLSLHYHRSQVALVSQEPILFRGSIMDNVRLGVENEVTEEDVRNACKLSNAANFIEDFPKGYETEVGEKGRSMSGGQKQRIAIARALVRNPKIIILDEATSALDTQSEQVVREALATSTEGRTSISIAHRLDTIKHCDEICFIDEGRIVERGTHEQLMNRKGRYAKMVEQQKLST